MKKEQTFNPEALKSLPFINDFNSRREEPNAALRYFTPKDTKIHYARNLLSLSKSLMQKSGITTKGKIRTAVSCLPDKKDVILVVLNPTKEYKMPTIERNYDPGGSLSLGVKALCAEVIDHLGLKNNPEKLLFIEFSPTLVYQDKGMSVWELKKSAHQYSNVEPVTKK